MKFGAQDRHSRDRGVAKPVLPVKMYAKLLAGLDGIRDRAIFLIACFYALRLRSDLGMLHQQ